VLRLAYTRLLTTHFVNLTCITLPSLLCPNLHLQHNKHTNRIESNRIESNPPQPQPQQQQKCLYRVETALTPAAHHALGWGPIESSGVLGSTSVVIFVCMMIVFYLSAKKVHNQILIGIGCVLWVIGGSLMYILWKAPGKNWHFIVPIMVAICGFPFIAPCNRSVFTIAVDTKPELARQHGFMQALLSTIASAAGFM
jgi:hypothetical protein